MMAGPPPENHLDEQDRSEQDSIQDPGQDDIQDSLMVPSPRHSRSADTAADFDRQAAAAVVAEAVALAMEAASAEAAEAVLATAAAVTIAAGRAAEAAESARGARAFAAEAAAQSVAREGRITAAHVRMRAEAAAARVQRAAALAADELVHGTENGTALDERRLAIMLEATVRAAADATAEDTTRAANAVRTAEAAAAEQTAQEVASAAQVVEREVATAVEAQRALAADTATQVALETEAKAAGVAKAAEDAAAALLDDEEGTRGETQPRPAAGAKRFGGQPPSSIVPSVKTLEVALRESDNRFQFLVDAVTEYAIMTLTPDGVIESWNTGAERLQGYTPQEALGRHFSIFYTADDCEAGLPQRLLDRARAEGSCEATGWRIRKDGSQFWGDIIISAVRDDTGNLTGYVKVTRDLTEQHRLEIAQDSFYYAFEHDFRVPITAIKGFAELIKNAEPEDQKYLATRVDSNANRLLDMVKELVDYARLRSGLVPIGLQIVDLAPFTQIAVANLAAMTDTSRVEVTASSSVKVLADPAALERVIANLVVNALKYSPAGSHVVLICERVRDAGVLRIVDHGRGIDGRDLGSIFLEFERGRLAQDDSGTGLGLASVQRLVELQHGTVDITSELQVGTTVTIQLPPAPDSHT